MAIHTGKHLAEALGEDYVSQMCGGALLQMDDTVHSLRGVYESGVSYITNSIKLTDNTPQWTTSTIPQDRLKSLADLAYPRLGYRQVVHDKFGPVVIHLSNPRSAMRGLRIDRVLAQPPQSLNAILPMAVDIWEIQRSELKVKSIYAPTFTPFAEGLRKVIAGEYVSFASSEDVAVVMTATAGPDIVAEILFRERSVGFASGNGDLHLNNKILQKHGLVGKLGL